MSVLIRSTYEELVYQHVEAGWLSAFLGHDAALRAENADLTARLAERDAQAGRLRAALVDLRRLVFEVFPRTHPNGERIHKAVDACFDALAEPPAPTEPHWTENIGPITDTEPAPRRCTCGHDVGGIRNCPFHGWNSPAPTEPSDA